LNPEHFILSILSILVNFAFQGLEGMAIRDGIKGIRSQTEIRYNARTETGRSA
jgi:hypothetical protein